MTTSPSSSAALLPAVNLLGWDCVEFWVGNARTTAGFFMSTLGFTCTAYAGPETGVRAKASYVLEQGDIRFVVSGALEADSPIATHVRRHGDGVHDLAWLVDDVDGAYRASVERGADGLRPPWTESDAHGELQLAQVGAYGETVHTFVDRARYDGTVLEPGYSAENLPTVSVGGPVGLTAIDHIVGNVEQGKLDDWVRFYEQVLGFGRLQHFDDDHIRTEYSALMSTVVWNGSAIVMPLNEPATGLKSTSSTTTVPVCSTSPCAPMTSWPR
jgi:4-hydroxyphenylpyruvate dioxygenase